MSSTAAGSRITVYFPAGISRGTRGIDGLLRGCLGQSQGIEIRHIRRIRLLPPRGIGRQHGDRNFRRSLRMPAAQPARIEDSFKRFSAGVDARSRELVPVCHADDLPDALSAQLGSDRRSLFEVPGRDDSGRLVWGRAPRPSRPPRGRQASATDPDPDAAPSPATPNSSPPAAGSRHRTCW